MMEKMVVVVVNGIIFDREFWELTGSQLDGSVLLDPLLLKCVWEFWEQAGAGVWAFYVADGMAYNNNTIHITQYRTP